MSGFLLDLWRKRGYKMYLGVIPIDKKSIPYRFTIKIYNNEYMFEIRYNETADLFTLTLLNSDGNIICIEPIVYGVPLFEQQYQPNKYPAAQIIPKDLSGNENTVTWDNFSKTVFLYLDIGGANDK